ncbi:MAG: substrate-binding domain-containing protein [Prolixibacteraceae bacterium]|nr:substrate-binding domain-containing protein [Prolixibacteraceae bacterium]
MKTKILIYLLLAGLVLVGCSSGKPKIGLLVHSYDTPRWQSDEKYFTEAVDQLGGISVVKMAENDAQKQIQQAKELIDEGISVLVVVPVDQFSAGQIVDMAHKNNIKVIAYDRLINNCWLDYYVSSDNVRIGEIQAEYLTNTIPAGNYALIGGPTYDNNSRMIFLGQMNIIQPYIDKGQISLIYNVFSDYWTEAEGYKHTLQLIETAKGDVDAILAGNDAIALGALRALKEKGLAGKVKLAGQDADLANIQEIMKGNQTMTVYKPIKTMAYTVAELAIHLADESPVPLATSTISNGNRLVPSYLVNPMAINESNIQMTVVAEGYQEADKILK